MAQPEGKGAGLDPERAGLAAEREVRMEPEGPPTSPPCTDLHRYSDRRLAVHRTNHACHAGDRRGLGIIDGDRERVGGLRDEPPIHVGTVAVEKRIALDQPAVALRHWSSCRVGPAHRKAIVAAVAPAKEDA